MSKHAAFCDGLAIALRPVEGVRTEAVRRTCEIFPKQIIEQLEKGPITLDNFNKGFTVEMLPEAYLLLQRLWKLQALVLMNRVDSPDLCIRPTMVGTILDLRTTGSDDSWKLSRFAFLRLDCESGLRIETPKHPFIIDVLNPLIGHLFAMLAKPVTAKELLECLPWIEDSLAIHNLLLLLRNGSVIDLCDAAGKRVEDKQPELQQWEFHDLLFHHRSRKGSHSEPIGAHYRFKGHLPAPPVIKKNPWAKSMIALPHPEIAMLAATDPTFTVVLESRRSIRNHNTATPISISQIGEFLYRTARIRETYQTPMGEFTSRPYPNGGASYELELYISINACAGLKRGFYYYDAAAHALCPIHGENSNLEAILDEAWLSSARLCHPQVLITVASRFHRVSWKYSGMAYATQLKNVGALYQTFYLVATAMNLAGCALGLGNAKRLSEMAGTDFFEESSIGEFMLGTPK